MRTAVNLNGVAMFGWTWAATQSIYLAFMTPVTTDNKVRAPAQSVNMIISPADLDNLIKTLQALKEALK